MNSRVGSAYDSVAADYDRFLERDQSMRAVLWRRYLRIFQEGDHVLDFCCGTGLDALFLAGHGLHITGIDASAGMIGQLLKKATLEKNAAKITAQVGTTSDLEKMGPLQYDGIISAFAGLNTVPNLAQFAAAAHRLLRPGGKLVAHMLAPPGIWDWLKLARKGRWKEARELRRSREKIIVVCGEPIRHILLPARETYTQFFQSWFHLRRLYSLGFLWPYHSEDQIPKHLAHLGSRMESFVGRYRPFSTWGRFFVLEMEKKER